MVACMAVTYPKDIALIRLQAREGHLLKLVHDALFLLRCHLVVQVPGKNASREFPFCVQRVDKGMCGVHIPVQHFRRLLITAWIVLPNKVMRGAISPALAMQENFHIHGGFPSAGGGGVSLNCRSRLIRATSTSMTLAWLLWMFTHRASWFRFAPIRASWLTHSFSNGVCLRR